LYISAEMFLATEAETAVAAAYDSIDGAATPDPRDRYTWPDGLYNAGTLVSHRVGRLDKDNAALQHVEIGAADARRPHREQDLAGAGLWEVYWFAAQTAVTIPHPGFAAHATLLILPQNAVVLGHRTV
jgi:hypothetical protein